MAAVDLATRQDVEAVLAELREVRAALDALRRQGAEEMLDLEQAARVLGVSRRTVERLVKSGRLPSAQVGARRRVRRADLDALAG